MIAAAVIVLWLGGIVSVVCSVVLSKGYKPFMRDLMRAPTSPSFKANFTLVARAYNYIYYIKVSGIASGNKLIKTIRYPHM